MERTDGSTKNDIQQLIEQRTGIRKAIILKTDSACHKILTKTGVTKTEVMELVETLGGLNEALIDHDEEDDPEIREHSEKCQILANCENYAITEMECLAIVEAVKQWHCYIHRKSITVYMDHSALHWLRSYKNLSIIQVVIGTHI